jgi:aerobic carbon-monoxide dehydrogenase medium subunit
VKPAKFRYVAPQTLPEALALLEEHGDEAKVVAGGQSLVPMMNFRLARPEILVDINRIEELSYIEPGENELSVGATTTQRCLEKSDAARVACRAVPQALRHVGHIQTRNRGTVGGSVAHADPAAEIPAVLLAAEGSVRLASAGAERWVDAADFFLGPYETVVEPNEILVEVRIPTPADAVSGFMEVAPRMGDFATCGVAAFVRFQPGSDVVDRVALAAVGVDSRPVRLPSAEDLLVGHELSADAVDAAAAASRDDVDPMPDLHSDASFRRRLLSALVARVLGDVRYAATA